MGGSKREWEEYHERGWLAPDKVVCPDCVNDDFLKDIIRKNANSCQCDYCLKETSSVVAASVEDIMPAVAGALQYVFAPPEDSGMPYDEGYLVDPIDTASALMDISFDGHEKLCEDIANAFSNNGWVYAAGGNWASSHRNQEWSSAWNAFAEKVTHQSRYFFMPAIANIEGWTLPEPLHGPAADGIEVWTPQEPPDISGADNIEHWALHEPLDILSLIGRLVGQLELQTSLPKNTPLFRVRERVGNADWPISAEQLGAPPNGLANAGRMNPAGISYLYLSNTEKGALAEVLREPPCHAVVANFETIRVLTVLDLTRLPQLPSVFDESKREFREAILFLKDFVADICKPIQKDGREHINYVPSQVVSEYFSQVFKTPEGEQLDGIVYPSAASPGSENLALFPRTYGYNSFNHIVKFISGAEASFDTSTEFSRVISECGNSFGRF